MERLKCWYCSLVVFITSMYFQILINLFIGVLVIARHWTETTEIVYCWLSYDVSSFRLRVSGSINYHDFVYSLIEVEPIFLVYISYLLMIYYSSFLKTTNSTVSSKNYKVLIWTFLWTLSQLIEIHIFVMYVKQHERNPWCILLYI